jgi:hypothetical protein
MLVTTKEIRRQAANLGAALGFVVTQKMTIGRPLFVLI